MDVLKQYKSKTKDNVKKYNTKYYLKNKESIRDRLKEKIECGECGKSYSRSYISRHMKIHKRFKEMD